MAVHNFIVPYNICHVDKMVINTLWLGVKYRWVDAYFPFTHPSWELEVFHQDRWMELLGCGIMEQRILQNGDYFPS